MTLQEIIKWLNACSKSDCNCKGCPYEQVTDYDDGCGKLLADAAALLAKAYPDFD